MLIIDISGKSYPRRIFNQTFLEYFGYALDTLSPKFTPEMLCRWGIGGFEAINAGVTTL